MSRLIAANSAESVRDEYGDAPSRRKRLLANPSDEHWAGFVDSIPDANIFHHPAWIGLLAECYGYRPFVAAISDVGGEIQSGVPLMEINSPLTGRRWISLPFTDHCTPLWRDGMPHEELVEYVSELRIKESVPSVQIRSALPNRAQAYVDNRQVLHLLELSSDTQAIFGSLHRTRVQQSIAKAEREDVRIRWGEDKKDMDVFYKLHLATRQRLGVPVQPRRFFELVWERLVRAGLAFILVAYKGSRPIAGAVFLTYKSRLVYKYGASDKDYWRFRPNHLLFWTAIRWGCEHEHNLFDWGRTNVKDTGLRSFKNGWGTQESTLTYSVLSTTPPKYGTDRLSGITGPLIRHAPRWVCRISGELLYKHFA